MSRSSSHRNSRRGLLSLIGAVALSALTPGIASAACASKPTSQAFSQFGDNASYTLMSGGSFESGGAGWSLSGAGVAGENESFNLTPGSHSLAVGAWGSAASPWVCISSEYPTFRFIARQLGGAAGAGLNVNLRWISVLGLDVETTVGTLHSGSAWAPSPAMSLGNAVPLWMPGGTLQVSVVFQPSWGSSWALDDVYIDPYSR